MQRILFYIVYAFLWVISILPFPIFYFISDCIYVLVYRIIGYRKKTVRDNIKLTLPHLTDKEVLQVEKKFYHHMCDMFMEMIKSMNISEEEMKKRFVFTNLEVYKNFEAKNKSIIVMYAHYASWEWMLSIGYHTVSQGYGIYTPIMNKYLNELIIEIRKKHRGELLSRYGAIQKIKNLHEGGTVAVYGFVSDQSPRPKPKSYWRSFLGVKVPVFLGAEMIAREFDFGVVYAKINRVKRGYYEASFELISDQPKKTEKNRITDTFTEWLEQDIYCDPTQYLWTHKRFKHMDKAPKD